MAEKVTFTVVPKNDYEAALRAASFGGETPYAPKTGTYRVVGTGVFHIGDGPDMACIFVAAREGVQPQEWKPLALALFSEREYVTFDGLIKPVNSPFGKVDPARLIKWANSESLQPWSNRKELVVGIEKIPRKFEGASTPTIHRVRYISGTPEAVAAATAFNG